VRFPTTLTLEGASAMLFIDNKYTRWYFNIINAAKARQTNTGYTERHHIIPRTKISLAAKNRNKSKK
jgi:hypothetical protein